MKISIAMTTYNGCRYIEPQLRSIMEQSRCPDEVIVCDDGSADGTLEWIETVSLKHPNIHWILQRNTQNLGWQANFMQAFSLTTGDVIFCADQDDVWHPEKIEKMCAILEAYPECELLGCDYILIDGAGVPAGTKRVLYPLKKGEKLEKIPFSPVFYESVRPGCAVAFRRSLLEAATPYWVEKYPHDELLWNFAVLRNTAYVIHEPLLCYRVHDRNATTKWNTVAERLEMLFLQERICQQTLKYAQHHELPEQVQKVLRQGTCFFTLREKALQTQRPLNLIKLLPMLPYYTYLPAFLKDWQYARKSKGEH